MLRKKNKKHFKKITLIVPDRRIDTLPKQRQNQIIDSIIRSAVGTVALRRASGRTMKVPQLRLKKNKFDLRKFIFRKLSKNSFVFTPDIYSVIFGIRAKPKERLILLKPVRSFNKLKIRK